MDSQPASIKDRNSHSKNFTEEENLLLAEIVASKKSILENKKSGAITNKQKEKAWVDLAQEFNALNSRNLNRSAEILRNKWRNIKKTSTKNYSNNKKSFKNTGGGSPEQFLEGTPVDALVHDVIGERMTGLPSVCDSDVVTNNSECNYSEYQIEADGK